MSISTLRYCVLIMVLCSGIAGQAWGVNVSLGQEAIDEVFFEKEIESRLARDIGAYLGHNRFIVGVDFNLSADGSPGGEEGVIIREITTPLPGLPKASETFTRELTNEELANLEENLFLDDQVGTRGSVLDGQRGVNALTGSGTEIYLVLDTTVNSVQESFIRALIARKLNLDVVGGDSIQVVRSTFSGGATTAPTASAQQQFPNQYPFQQGSTPFIPGGAVPVQQPQQAQVVQEGDQAQAVDEATLPPTAEEIAVATLAAVGLTGEESKASFLEENIVVIAGLAALFMLLLVLLILLLSRRSSSVPVPYYQPAPSPAPSDAGGQKTDSAYSEASAVRNAIGEVRREIASVGLASPESSKVEMENLLAQGRMDIVVPVYKVLGEDVFESLFGTMPPSQKTEIGEYLAEREISDTQLEAQAREFYSRAVRAASESAQGSRSQAFKFLSKLHISQILFLMKGEKARIRALIVSQLPAKTASAVLQGLEANQRSEVIHELAQFETFPVETFRDVASMLARKARKLPAVENVDTDGIGILMNLLDSMNNVEEGRVLADLERKDPDLHQKLRSCYFTFSDLAGVSQKIMGEAILDMDKGYLAAALAGANDNIVKRVLGSLPKRLADAVKEEMTLLKGKLDEEQIQDAQRILVGRMRDLVREGKIVVGQI